MNKLNQKGFGGFELVLILVVAGVIGYASWYFINTREKATNTSTPISQTDSTPQVNSASDLKEAEDYLNKEDIDSQLDTSEIDNTLAE